MSSPQHPILTALPNLELLIFVRHIMWSDRDDVPEMQPEQIFQLLTFEELEKRTSVSADALQQAHLLSSPCGRVVTSAVHFAQRLKLAQNLINMKTTICLRDKSMGNGHDEHVKNSGVFGRSLMRNELSDTLQTPPDTRVLVLFSHGPNCDYLPSVLCNCSGELQILSRPADLKTERGQIRWINLKHNTTGTFIAEI